MKAQRGSRGIALLFLQPGWKRGWMGKATPRPPHPREGDPIRIVQQAGWVSGPACSLQQSYQMYSHKLVLCQISDEVRSNEIRHSNLAYFFFLLFNNNIYLTAIGLQPGGSSQFTYIQDLLLDLGLGGLHEKHVVATWHLGYHLSICSWTQENLRTDLVQGQ